MEKKNKQSEPSFYVNFEKVYARNIDSNISLLNFLRHNCKFTGTKEGCSEGDCGACSVLIFDEKGFLAPVNSCILKVGQIIDKNIVTIEGASKLSSAKPLIQALNSEAASQCGFCTPGFVMAALALKEKHKSPSESVIHDSLSGNLCRCTGYKPIVNGIQSLEKKIKFPMPINSKGSKLKTAIFGKTTYIYPDSKKELIEFISKEKNYTVLSGGTDWNLEAEDSNFKEQKILFLNNIKEMSEISKFHNSEFYLVIYPWAETLEYGQKEFNWSKYASNLCTKYKCITIDTIPYFQKYMNINKNWVSDLYFKGDEHFNKGGAKLLGDAVIKFIKNKSSNY